jgi:hypothetical protein
MKNPQSGDQIIIATFDLMKNEKICQSPDQKTFDPLFRSHEIQPPDSELLRALCLEQ